MGLHTALPHDSTLYGLGSWQGVKHMPGRCTYVQRCSLHAQQAALRATALNDSGGRTAAAAAWRRRAAAAVGAAGAQGWTHCWVAREAMHLGTCCTRLLCPRLGRVARPACMQVCIRGRLCKGALGGSPLLGANGEVSSPGPGGLGLGDEPLLGAGGLGLGELKGPRCPDGLGELLLDDLQSGTP